MTTDHHETLTIGALTDEELAALATTDGLSVFPVLGAMPEEHRDIAVRTAYRSLVARGVIEAPTPEEEAEAVARAGDGALLELPVRMPESLRHVLALRAGARHVVAVSRATALGEEYRYAYAVEDVVLEEHVTATGLHTFLVAAADGLVDTLAGWALHPEATDGSGEPAAIDPTRPSPRPSCSTPSARPCCGPTSSCAPPATRRPSSAGCSADPAAPGWPRLRSAPASPSSPGRSPWPRSARTSPAPSPTSAFPPDAANPGVASEPFRGDAGDSGVVTPS